MIKNAFIYTLKCINYAIKKASLNNEAFFIKRFNYLFNIRLKIHYLMQIFWTLTICYTYSWCLDIISTTATRYYYIYVVSILKRTN